MFAIIGNILACVMWGGLISILLLVGVYMLLKLFYAYYSWSIWSGLVMLVLLVFLFIQSCLMMGAVYAKDYVEEASLLAYTLIEEAKSHAGEVNKLAGEVKAHAGEVEELTGDLPTETVTRHLKKEFPVFAAFAEDFDCNKLARKGQVTTLLITAEIKALINFYILRRVLWILGFLVVGLAVLCKLQPKRSYTYGTGYYGGGGSAPSSTMKF